MLKGSLSKAVSELKKNWLKVVNPEEILRVCQTEGFKICTGPTLNLPRERLIAYAKKFGLRYSSTLGRSLSATAIKLEQRRINVRPLQPKNT